MRLATTPLPTPRARRRAGHRRRMLVVAGPAAGAALLIAAQAVAQATGAPEPRPADAQLPPVVVTGEKIERDLLETTTSIGVIDARRLDQTGVRTLPDAFRLLGNVRDADFVDSGILIRGINSEGVGGPAGRPLATVAIDGVAQTPGGVRRGALGLWDVERVEVLRGPQSTISGRNALAGAVNVKTFDPSFVREAAAQVGLGTERHHGAAAMLSGPLTDQLAYRITAEGSRADGFVEYPGYAGLPRLEERANDRQWQGRAKLLWRSRPADGVRVLVTHALAYDSPAYDDVDGPSAGVDYFDRRWGAQALPVFVEARSTRNESTALEVSAPFAAGWRLTSLTTHTRSRTDRSSVDLASTGLVDQRESAQEFRVNLDTDTLRAVAGVYLNRETFGDDRDQIRPFQPTVLRRDLREGSVDNEALFGEVNLTRGPLTWIAGLRYDRERQSSSSANSRITVGTGAVTSSTTSTTQARYDAFLPRLGLNWRLASDQSLGIVLSRGYRGGGGGIDALTGQPYTYDPETADNLELSYRWESTDRRWRVAANAFHLRWRNQQINVPQIPGDFTSDKVVNAGRSTVQGGELEIQARPSRSWDVFASLGMADTRFDEFRFTQAGAVLDLTGNPFPQAPKWNGAFGAQWRLGGWFAGGDVKHTGRALSRSLLEGVPADLMPDYTVLNLRGGFQWDAWRLSVQMANVTDERYFLYRFDTPAFQVATVGRPRTVSVVLDGRF